MRKTIFAAALAAIALPSAPALADHGHGKRDKHSQRYQTTDDGIRYWRGDDGRTYCRRGNGTVGLLVGGAAGALLGREVDTRGSRTTGTVIGAAAGALLGREVDRNRKRNRCR